MLNKRTVLSEFQKTLSFDRIYTKGRLGDAEIGRATAETLRIVSWNIGRGYKLDRIAAALAIISPDVACLQEVDWSNRRTNNRDVLGDLASETGCWASMKSSSSNSAHLGARRIWLGAAQLEMRC